MKVQTTFALLLIFTAVGAAQENNSEEDKTQPVTVEANVLQSGSPRGEVPPEVPGERGVPKNSVQVGINAFGSYDNLGNTGGSGDATVGEGMVFRLNNQTRNGRTVLEYRPSYNYGTGSTQRSFGQVFAGDVFHRFGNRWKLRLQDSYSQTNDPFSGANSQLSSTESPNGTVVLPYVNQKSEVAVAELDWQASKRASVGLVGNFTALRYRQVAGLPSAQQPLLDSTNSSGRLFARYAFTKRFSAGIETQYQDLLIGNSFSRTQSYSAIAYTSIQLTKHSQLTLYGGPQRSHLFNTAYIDLGFFVFPIQVLKWSTTGTGGASYSLLMKHSRFLVNYSNRITDGGGLMGPVTLNAGSTSFEHDFSPRWTAALAFDYGNNKGLATDNTIRSIAGTATVRRKLTRDMNFSVSYQNLNQDQTPKQIGGVVSGNHNRVFASLEYVWTHPLGR